MDADPTLGPRLRSFNDKLRGGDSGQKRIATTLVIISALAVAAAAHFWFTAQLRTLGYGS
jgi:hypothetical protein